MQVYPAIDVQGGRVARSTDTGPATRYSLDPVALAERLVTEGAAWLHLVDLDRAFGSGDNDVLMRRIAAIPGVRVQAGGLLASPEQVARALELGATRAVIATAAAADPPVLDDIVSRVAPSRLAVAVDVRRGRVVLRGASRPLADSAEAVARRAVAAGIGVVVHRDLDRDGALGGADTAGAARINGLGAEIIVAGGIASRAHLLAVRDVGLAGAIVGRALHEGRLSLAEALACLA